MQLPKTRKEALALGLPRYFTGKPCKHGHIAERKTKGGCIECRRAYRETHREKDREYNAKHYIANRDKVRKRHALWEKANSAKTTPEVKKRKADWRRANPEKISRYCAKYVKNNLEKVRERRKQYTRIYPEKHRARRMFRHARKLKATPSWLTQEQKAQIANIYEQAVLCERLTGVVHHVDHIEPLQGKDRCGLHVPWNLQVLTAAENNSKYNH